MTIEMSLLVWSTAIVALYVIVQASLYSSHHGAFAATSRDNEPPASPMSGRATRALRNLLETYPIFVVLGLVAAMGRGDDLTLWGSVLYLVARLAYLPLYVFGVKNIRSLAWTAGFIGLVLMFVGVAF